MTQVVTILVDVERAGSAQPGDAKPLKFKYSIPNSNDTTILNDRVGNISLQEVGYEVRLIFALQEDAIDFDGKKFFIKFHQPEKSGRSACLFGPTKDSLAPYPAQNSKDEFADFVVGKDYVNRETLRIHVPNRKWRDWHYALVVDLYEEGSTIMKRIIDDPQIKNGGNEGRFLGVRVQAIINALYGAALLILVARVFRPHWFS